MLFLLTFIFVGHVPVIQDDLCCDFCPIVTQQFALPLFAQCTFLRMLVEASLCYLYLRSVGQIAVQIYYDGRIGSQLCFVCFFSVHCSSVNPSRWCSL